MPRATFAAWSDRTVVLRSIAARPPWFPRNDAVLPMMLQRRRVERSRGSVAARAALWCLISAMAIRANHQLVVRTAE
jgi:hypothetical protein